MTAELAVALPAVLLLLAFLVTGAAAGLAQVRAEGAARAAARAIARGEPESAARGMALQQCGPGAQVSIGGGPLVRVRVEQQVPVAGGVVLPLTVVAEATGAREATGAAGAVVFGARPSVLDAGSGRPAPVLGSGDQDHRGGAG